jgi:hypothetical protein
MTREDAETILRIARERAALLARLKAAQERNDEREARRLARQVTGLDSPDEEIANESHRAETRIH